MILPWFFPFFQKCTVILPIFYRDFLTALLMMSTAHTQLEPLIPVELARNIDSEPRSPSDTICVNNSTDSPQGLWRQFVVNRIMIDWQTERDRLAMHLSHSWSMEMCMCITYMIQDWLTRSVGQVLWRDDLIECRHGNEWSRVAWQRRHMEILSVRARSDGVQPVCVWARGIAVHTQLCHPVHAAGS